MLAIFLDSRHRDGRIDVAYDAASSLGHVVESVGVPLTEVGELLVGGRPAAVSERIPPGLTVAVRPAPRPQALPGGEAAFCLDVHLGALARRLRLVGLDTWYRNDAGDDELIEVAAGGKRVLLTKDRGLLRRRAVRAGAYVRGDDPDAQLLDVLDRFAPPLAPWTRCPACNGPIAPVDARDIGHLLQPGTRRTYREFARCLACGRPYWHGAHSAHLDALVGRARQVVAARAGARRDRGTQART